MKKILFFSLMLLILSFSIHNQADAASFKIVSPKKGEVYQFGEVLNVRWTPKNIGVTTIEIVSKDTSDGLTIYADKVYGYPTNYSGSYAYELPEHLTIRPGRYQIRAVLENGSEYKGEIFQIQHDGLYTDVSVANPRYILGNFSGVQKFYTTQDNIEISIPAYESKGIVATPENGFNLQAHLYKNSNTKSALEAVNATYDYYSQTWKIKLDTPTKTGSYKLIATIYCGNISKNSYCANKYGNNGQVEKELKINVKKAPKSKVSNINKNDNFISGDAKYPVKFVTYTDFECPFCKGFHSTLKKLNEEYSNDIAFIYRNYPLYQIHSSAMNTAHAVECSVNLGGKNVFSEYVDRVFEISPDLTIDNLINIASTEGIDENKFRSCLLGQKYSNKIKKDMDSVSKFVNSGTFGTPYSIVFDKKGNTKIIAGNQPIEDIRAILNQMLEE